MSERMQQDFLVRQLTRLKRGGCPIFSKKQTSWLEIVRNQWISTNKNQANIEAIRECKLSTARLCRLLCTPRGCKSEKSRLCAESNRRIQTNSRPPTPTENLRSRRVSTSSFGPQNLGTWLAIPTVPVTAMDSWLVNLPPLTYPVPEISV